MNKAGYFGWIMSPPVIVEFESDSILLSINDTSNAAEGWAVTATFPPAKVRYLDDYMHVSIFCRCIKMILLMVSL